jgi:hypothetical protein
MTNGRIERPFSLTVGAIVSRGEACLARSMGHPRLEAKA